MMGRAAVGFGAALLTLCAHAQDAAPTADPGTTIVGEQESPMGLVLLPWAEEFPSDLDRPPRAGPAAPLAIDPFAYTERVQYEREREAYRLERLQRVK